jgi:hypothetical protein
VAERETLAACEGVALDVAVEEGVCVCETVSLGEALLLGVRVSDWVIVREDVRERVCVIVGVRDLLGVCERVVVAVLDVLADDVWDADADCEADPLRVWLCDAVPVREAVIVTDGVRVEERVRVIVCERVRVTEGERVRVCVTLCVLEVVSLADDDMLGEDEELGDPDVLEETSCDALCV